MPEPLGLLWSTPETKKKAPIIKVSCGIGDTDGFPAFDVESEVYDSKDDEKWGFLITGGAEFHMPLTVFQVTPNSIADKSGIRLGDIILEINEEDATQLTLAQAHERINATPKKVQLVMRNMEEDDPTGMFEAGEEKSIVMRVPKPMPPPKDFTPTPLLGSRCWHPIMWQEPPEPPKPKKKKTKTQIDEEGNEVIIELSEDESSDEEEQELPHHRIIRNIKRFFAEVGDNEELRSSTIENMLMALPTASKSNSIELRLLEMQRKLSAIAEIPKILTSTLQTVSQSFGSLQDVELSYMQRKCSYDEDALDYELATEDEHEHGDGDEAESEEAGQEDDLVQVPEDDDDEERLLQQCVAKQLKDLTPESDYASEVNYATNELNDEPDEELDTADEDVDEDENESALKTVYYMKLPAVSYSEHDGSDGHEAEERDGDDDDDDDDSDFLSTTYTWNLRNVPKLRVSDAESPQLETPANASDTSKVRPATPTPAPTPKPTCTPTPKDMLEATIASPTESQKLLFKLDNLERSWPWADREKIIYKQSTCHLVPRKPLGIVSQRVQLLAKQELQRKDKTQ